MENLTNLANETYIVGLQVFDIMEVNYMNNLPGISRQ